MSQWFDASSHKVIPAVSLWCLLTFPIWMAITVNVCLLVMKKNPEILSLVGDSIFKVDALAY